MNEKRTLEIKHVADLLNMHFHIPSYQRGYRWESKHVEALLDDLYAFSIQISETEGNKQGKFYCIQPLAVVKNETLSDETDTVYDVIDGQQRLTTLYLLLSYLGDARKCNWSGELATSLFTLKYESRDADFFDKQEFKNCDIKDAIRNIDFFYMTRAYKTIEAWFENKGINKNLILKVLIPEGYHVLTGLNGDELKKEMEHNDKQNDVRFIWYEVPIGQHTDSIEVFSQLNYGKTALTATELVKALLFQCDIYTKDKQLMQEVAFRSSCEWDAMEKQLQDPFMWSMFMQSDNSFSSHITVVLSLVCNKLYKELKNKPGHNIQEKSEDFIYQVCNSYLGTGKDSNYAKNVTEVWTRIQTTYTALYNWYNNPDTYHLIGLLVWLKEYKNRDFDNKARFALLEELMNEYSSKPKDQFLNHLKKEIAKIIHIEKTIKTQDGVVPWGLKHINYHENALQLIKILVTFNVEDIRTRQEESARFPFHLLREQNITSLEHIHPQHLDLNNIKLDTLQTWLAVKEEHLKQLKKYESYSDDIARLKELMQDENAYKNNKDAAQSIINKIDNEFDELANMKEEQMHTLYNMALVDKDTNSALSNNLLDTKREILLKRQEENGIYVLPATQKAFRKHYSHVNASNVLPQLWTQLDRESYFAAIERVYNDFDSLLIKE